MKIIGIIGGIGPESTIEYYRRFVAAHRERTRDGSFPSIFIDSIDAQRMLGSIAANDLPATIEYLVAEVGRLAAAGAEIGLLAANTPHVVFEDVRRRSAIPLVSIVEATRTAAEDLGLRRLGLFGTRFTMHGRFYPDVFEPAGLAVVLPEPDEQTFIHDAYMGELLHGVFLPATRARLLAIADRMRDAERIDGLILGGTELPLLLGEVTDRGMPFLDTTRIHVQRVLAELSR